jgi:NAD(P)H-dependent FMN reductase
MTTNILVLLGSLRAGSVNRRAVEHVRDHAPQGVHLEVAEGLGDLPFYNADLDTDAPPAVVVALREAVAAADRVLVVTPEFNGNVPAVVSNAVDWLSRPFGAGALRGKPLAVVGASFGRYGGVWAHDVARRSATVAGAQVLEEVQVSVRPEGDDPALDPALIGAVTEAVRTLAAYDGAVAAA